MKTCAKCGEAKPFEEFHRRKSNRDGRGSWCKPCTKDYTAQWHAAHPGRKKRYQETYLAANPGYKSAYMRLYQYGLTPEAFAKMLADQGSVCAACGGPSTDWGWEVDHDHACCATRPTCGKCTLGIVCRPCNDSNALDRNSR